MLNDTSIIKYIGLRIHLIFKIIYDGYSGSIKKSSAATKGGGEWLAGIGRECDEAEELKLIAYIPWVNTRSK